MLQGMMLVKAGRRGGWEAWRLEGWEARGWDKMGLAELICLQGLVF